VSELVETKLAAESFTRSQLMPLPLWQTTVLAILILWLYGPTLVRLTTQWWQDPNCSHGFLVPLFAIFVVWHNRARFARLKPRPSWSGLLILGFALLMLVVGQMGAELFLTRFSLLLVTAGLIVLFFGWDFFRAALFPWAVLILMIPIPAILYNQVTFPLQLLASRVASVVLAILGIPVLREGNVITLPSMALEVAEACSGIRSLMSLITLAIIYGFIAEKRRWVRYLLVVASVPIAVMANSLRIIGTGLLVQYWNVDAAQDYFHASWGWIVFVVSLLLLYAFHQLVRAIWQEEGATS
jgi:exosortase